MTKKKDKVDRRKFIKAGAGLGVGAATMGVFNGKGKGKAFAGDKEPATFPDQDSSEVRWGFLIDMNRCTGCNACAVACKTEYDVRLGRFRDGVITYDEGNYPDAKRHFAPWLCNQCKKPSCLENSQGEAVCPVEPVLGTLNFPNGTAVSYWARATYQRPDGLVLIDQDRCIGCGKCVTACPYQVRYLDPVKAAGGDPSSYGFTISNPKAADKCTFCTHRLEKGVVPACVNTCPAGARLVGNLNDTTSEINTRITAGGTDVSVIMESVGTEPKVFYIKLNADVYSKGTEPRREAGLQTVVPDLD